MVCWYLPLGWDWRYKIVQAYVSIQKIKIKNLRNLLWFTSRRSLVEPKTATLPQSTFVCCCICFLGDKRTDRREIPKTTMIIFLVHCCITCFWQFFCHFAILPQSIQTSSSTPIPFSRRWSVPLSLAFPKCFKEAIHLHPRQRTEQNFALHCATSSICSL